MATFENFQEVSGGEKYTNRASVEALLLALRHFKVGRLVEAEQLYHQILQQQPQQPEALHWLGVIVYQNGNVQEAFDYLQQSLALNPYDANAQNSMGVALMEQGNLERAADHFQRAIALNPNHFIAHTNLGNVLRNQDNLQTAVHSLQTALALNPNDVSAHNGLGVALMEQGNLAAAVVHLQQAIALDPNDADVHCNLSHALLLMGDLRNGFTEYEWRWKTKQTSLRLFSQPLWDGSDLEGTVLLHSERGLGDTIQFIRYASLVRARSSRVIVACETSLMRLLETVPGVDQVIVPNTPSFPEFQAHAPLLSLPGILATTLESVPAQIPYVFPPTAHQFRLERLPDPKFKVGIVWASGYRREDLKLLRAYQQKSCPLLLYDKLLKTPGINFYSLQVGHNTADIAQLESEYQLQDLSSHIHDFADTAALIDQLDLVISVDTAVAHLAGALGKPVWLLLPFAADWRWLQERQDSPWYPTMRLFRQLQPNDWEGVINRVAEALKSVVDGVLKPVFELEPIRLSTTPSQSAVLDLPLTNSYKLHDSVSAPQSVNSMSFHSIKATSEALALAFQHFQAGQSAEAERHYRQILQQQPEQPEALHWLGVIVYQNGSIQEAFNYLQQSLALNPKDANAQNSMGAALMEQGDLEQASIHLQQAIALNPNHYFAHNNLANVLLRQGNLEAAIQSFQTALTFNSNDADAYNNLGSLLHQQDKLEEAAHYYYKAISLRPDHLMALTNLGNLLRTQGNLGEALRHFQTAFTLNPNYAPIHNALGLAYLEQRNLVMAAAHLQQAISLQELSTDVASPTDADAHYNLGLVLKEQGKLDAVIMSYEKAIALNPSHVLALTSLGDMLQEQDRLPEAILSFQTALTLSPNEAAVHTGLGIALKEQGNLAQAVFHLQRAIALNPQDAQAYSNLGGVLWEQGNLEQAIDRYQSAIRLKPDHAEAHLCLSQCLLMAGDLQNGFAEYEWRWQTQEWSPHAFPQPLWDGSDLNGEAILLHPEGGFGDIIQFIRYAPLVSDRGGQVIISCPAILKRLFETVSGVTQLIALGEALPEFQVHAPLLSLPHILQTTLETVPATIPYLTPPTDYALKLEQLPGTHLKVGISWASGYNPKRNLLKNHQTRSCPLSEFAKLLTVPGISFYSLQVGHNASDIAQLEGGFPLQDLSPQIKDFADTAALIAQMDLVISVDTAIIHLAGALGKPVWVLLSQPHDWRWMVGREDTPWYPTMRLFRQGSPGDWNGSIIQAVTALKDRVGGGMA